MNTDFYLIDLPEGIPACPVGGAFRVWAAEVPHPTALDPDVDNKQRYIEGRGIWMGVYSPISDVPVSPSYTGVREHSSKAVLSSTRKLLAAEPLKYWIEAYGLDWQQWRKRVTAAEKIADSLTAKIVAELRNCRLRDGAKFLQTAEDIILSFPEVFAKAGIAKETDRCLREAESVLQPDVARLWMDRLALSD